VADILEGLGGILAADVEKNLLATAIQKNSRVSTCLWYLRRSADAGNGETPIHPGR
jgi:hypothetical protein